MLGEMSMCCGKDVELPIFLDCRKQINNVHKISEHVLIFFSPLYLVCTERVSLKMKYLYMYCKITMSACGKAAQIY